MHIKVITHLHAPKLHPGGPRAAIMTRSMIIKKLSSKDFFDLLHGYYKGMWIDETSRKKNLLILGANLPNLSDRTIKRMKMSGWVLHKKALAHHKKWKPLLE